MKGWDDNAGTELDTSRRSRIVLGLAGALGLGSLILLQAGGDLFTAFQFSVCLAMLGVVCFRWWTDPVHPGFFNYFSPLAVVETHFFLYFGPGNLPPLAAPEQIVLTYGSQDYYVPMLLLALLAIVIFDFSYRYLARKLRINESLKNCLESFSQPWEQRMIPALALTWYALCMGLFLYMSRSYLMQTFRFVGVREGLDTTYSIAGPELLGVTWGTLCFLFFRRGGRAWKGLALVLLATLLPIFMAYQNRRLFFYSIVAAVFAYVLNRKDQLRFSRLILGALAAAVAFLAMSMAKVTVTRADPGVGAYTREEMNIFSRAARILNSPSMFSFQPLEALLSQNARERMAGLDWPASIMAARHARDIPFLWGEENLTSLAMAVPRLIWPGKPSVGLAAIAYNHFGLAVIDPLGTPLASAYADGGVVGIAIGFPIMALLFAGFLKLILLRKEGMIIYAALLPLLMRFEDTLLRYPVRWIRWILIMIALDTLVGAIGRVYLSRRHENRH